MSPKQIATDDKALEINVIGGPVPYVTIRDSTGLFLDSFELRNSPLTIRRGMTPKEVGRERTRPPAP